MDLRARLKPLAFSVLGAALAAGVANVRPACGAEGRGVHLPRGRTTNFPYTRTDGGGFAWDIQVYGSVGQGTDHVYMGGVYCQINGSNLHARSQRVLLSPDGREIEIGPSTMKGINVYRRVRIYKDRPLARWIEIFENPGGGTVNLNVRIYSRVRYGVSSVVTSSGASAFTKKDWAFVTENRSSNPPSLLHIVCGERSKLRPKMAASGNTIQVNWQLAIPPRQAVILLHFVSQNRSVSAHKSMMSKFRLHELIRDLPAAARRMIVNFPVGFFMGEIELDRSDKADTIILTNGDPMYGRIMTESFNVSTFYGDLTLPADRVIGMVPTPGQTGEVRVLSSDAQIISGRISEPALGMVLSTGTETLKVPFERVKQWSYRISEDRPAEPAFAGPLVLLRTGDRLIFDGDASRLRFRTRHGTVLLNGKDLFRIVLDVAPNAVHRAFFANGSRLAGFLEPEQLEFALKLGPKMNVRRDMIAAVVFAREETPSAPLTQVVLNNEDVLLGDFTDESLTMLTDFGPQKIDPRNIRAAAFDPVHMGRAALHLWRGSVLRGVLQREEIGFAIRPGPEFRLHVGQIRSIVSSSVLPPEETRRRVERLIAQLGAQSYEDREAATEALVKEGIGIVPMLERYLQNKDPEIRRRIEEIVERIRSQESKSGGPLEERMFELLQFGPAG